METVIRFLGSKTFWVQVAAGATALGLFVNGELDVPGLFTALWGAASIATIRDTLAKRK